MRKPFPAWAGPANEEITKVATPCEESRATNRSAFVGLRAPPPRVRESFEGERVHDHSPESVGEVVDAVGDAAHVVRAQQNVAVVLPALQCHVEDRRETGRG